MPQNETIRKELKHSTLGITCNQYTVPILPNPKVLSPNIVTVIAKRSRECWAQDNLWPKPPLATNSSAINETRFVRCREGRFQNPISIIETLSLIEGFVQIDQCPTLASSDQILGAKTINRCVLQLLKGAASHAPFCLHFDVHEPIISLFVICLEIDIIGQIQAAK
jgi:hypothetical protein